MRSIEGYPRGRSARAFDGRIAIATSNELSDNDVNDDFEYPSGIDKIEMS